MVYLRLLCICTLRLELLNLKEGRIKDMSKLQDYSGVPPDLRSIRLLSIFAVLYVYREFTKDNPLRSNRAWWQRGLYVGPSEVVSGGFKIAVLTSKIR